MNQPRSPGVWGHFAPVPSFVVFLHFVKSLAFDGVATSLYAG